MQTAPACNIHPSVSLLEKTPILLETMLRDLPAELLQRKPAPPSAGCRSGKHSELGVITVSQMLNAWASRDLDHLRQIAEPSAPMPSTRTLARSRNSLLK